MTAKEVPAPLPQTIELAIVALRTEGHMTLAGELEAYARRVSPSVAPETAGATGPGWSGKHDRVDPDDEIVRTGCTFHIERMSDGHIWLAVNGHAPEGEDMKYAMTCRCGATFSGEADELAHVFNLELRAKEWREQHAKCISHDITPTFPALPPAQHGEQP